MMCAQVIVSLAHDGALQVELDGAMGTSRPVKLPEGEKCHEVLRTILVGRSSSRFEIGLDGNPTERQLRHWVAHSRAWPGDRCPFCRAEGWLDGRRGRSSGAVVLATHGAGHGQVTIRRLPPRHSKVRQVIEGSLEELGL